MTTFRTLLATPGKFHIIDAAVTQEMTGSLVGVVTGYPKTRLSGYQIPPEKIFSFPHVHASLMGAHRLGAPAGITRTLARVDRLYVERRIDRLVDELRPDRYIAMSSMGLRPGRSVQQKGGKFFVDRGSTHILHQEQVLRDLHADLGMPYEGPDPFMRRRELQEYEAADGILVPSTTCRDSFIERGMNPDKVHIVPYGVDLQAFRPIENPGPDGSLAILYAGNVSVRKRLHLVLQALREAPDLVATVRVAGPQDGAYMKVLRHLGLLEDPRVSFLGRLSRADLIGEFQRAHVLVLPSAEEGLALVQAQAMACGCPVVATRETGLVDLFPAAPSHGLVAEPDPGSILSAIVAMSDATHWESARNAVLARMEQVGGWKSYATHLRSALSSVS